MKEPDYFDPISPWRKVFKLWKDDKKVNEDLLLEMKKFERSEEKTRQFCCVLKRLIENEAKEISEGDGFTKWMLKERNTRRMNKKIREIGI